MNFGFTNDDKELERIIAWRDAAVADGWFIYATYGDSESIDRAWKLQRNGWIAQGITRIYELPAKLKYQASIHVWASDGLAVEPPSIYDNAELERRSHVCQFCNKEQEATERVGFAGRCCPDCLPEARKKIETRGWSD